MLQYYTAHSRPCSVRPLGHIILHKFSTGAYAPIGLKSSNSLTWSLYLLNTEFSRTITAGFPSVQQGSSLPGICPELLLNVLWLVCRQL